MCQSFLTLNIFRREKFCQTAVRAADKIRLKMSKKPRFDDVTRPPERLKVTKGFLKSRFCEILHKD